MADRPGLKRFPSINGTSMAASINGTASIVDKISMVGFGFSWTGTTPIGALSVQVSNDYTVDAMGNPANAGSWNTVYFMAGGVLVNTIALTGDTGNAFIEIPLTSAYAVRPVYTRTSGVGNLTAIVHGKVT